jgi:hypothetical protein
MARPRFAPRTRRQPPRVAESSCEAGRWLDASRVSALRRTRAITFPARASPQRPRLRTLAHRARSRSQTLASPPQASSPPSGMPSQKKSGQLSLPAVSPLVVPKGGLEPPRPLDHWTLNPARLPIPPLRPGRSWIVSSAPIPVKRCRGSETTL